MTTFVCMADHCYARWLNLCVKAIRSTHPDASILVFDLSPEIETIQNHCQDLSISYIPFPSDQWRWPAWIDRANFNFFWPRFTLRETAKYWLRRLRVSISGKPREGWMTDKEDYVNRMTKFCRIVSQKPHVLKAALNISSEHIAFIDVDAIVTKPLDQLFLSDFDLAVTCESPKDICISPNPPECLERPSYPIRAVNTGVIFLKNNTRSSYILDLWIQEMEVVQDLCVEQTSLANLIIKHKANFFNGHGETCEIRCQHSAPAKIMNIPCQIYNQTKIKVEMEALPDNAYISHFVGQLKKEAHWERVNYIIEKSLNNRTSTGS